jgi:hypothetical protein
MTADLKLEDVPCPACGTAGGVHVFSAPAYASNRPDLTFPYRRCPGCGALYASPRIPESEAGRFYTPTYHPSRSESDRLWKGLVQLATVLQMGLRDGDRLLDWGCGGGEFLWVLRALGKDARGFDAFGTGDVEGVLTDEAEALELLNDRRVVTMMDSLEHVFDPVALFRRLRRHPRLEVYVFVPRGDGSELGRFGRHAYIVQAPTHVFLPTERSLKAIAERAGWTVEMVPVPETEFREASWQLRLGGRAFAAQGPRRLREKLVARWAALEARLRRGRSSGGAHLGAVFRPAAGV